MCVVFRSSPFIIISFLGFPGRSRSRSRRGSRAKQGRPMQRRPSPLLSSSSRRVAPPFFSVAGCQDAGRESRRVALRGMRCILIARGGASLRTTPFLRAHFPSRPRTTWWSWEVRGKKREGREGRQHHHRSGVVLLQSGTTAVARSLFRGPKVHSFFLSFIFFFFVSRWALRF